MKFDGWQNPNHAQTTHSTHKPRDKGILRRDPQQSRYDSFAKRPGSCFDSSDMLECCFEDLTFSIERKRILPNARAPVVNVKRLSLS